MIFLWHFQEVLLFHSDMVEGKLQLSGEEGGTCNRASGVMGARVGRAVSPHQPWELLCGWAAAPLPPPLGIGSTFQPLQLGPGKGEDLELQNCELMGDYREEPCNPKDTTELTKY